MAMPLTLDTDTYLIGGVITKDDQIPQSNNDWKFFIEQFFTTVEGQWQNGEKGCLKFNLFLLNFSN